MDLKDVIGEVKRDLEEADRAFHAGHHDTAKKFLNGVRLVIKANIELVDTTAGDVTESATNEKEKGKVAETKAEEPRPAAQPAAVDPAEAAQEIGSQRPAEKPTR